MVAVEKPGGLMFTDLLLSPAELIINQIASDLKIPDYVRGEYFWRSLKLEIEGFKRYPVYQKRLIVNPIITQEIERRKNIQENGRQQS